MQRYSTLTLLLLLLTACLLCSTVATGQEQTPVVPTIRVSPAVGPPTTYVLVSGSGFDPEEMLAVMFDGAEMIKTPTDHDGVFSVGINVPSKALPGPHLVQAKEILGTKLVRTNFLVRTDWTQFRFDSSHKGLDPYENLLSSTTVGRLTLRWSYQTGAAVYSSPTVANGVVYVGSYDKHLYALNASTGALLWKYPTAVSIVSSPAVVNGVVYASDNANMYALNAATGALLWKKSTGVEEHCGSPTVANGVWYWLGTGIFISSHVYAMDASNGNLLWSYFIGYPEDSPSYCSSAAVANGVVYVGARDGNLYALNAKTGAFLWKYTTGGPITSSPAVDAGIVYFGSDDNNLYVLNASSGALVWKYTTGAPIFSSPAVAYGMVYVGSQDNNVYALKARTGFLFWKYPTTPASFLRRRWRTRSYTLVAIRSLCLERHHGITPRGVFGGD